MSTHDPLHPWEAEQAAIIRCQKLEEECAKYRASLAAIHCHSNLALLKAGDKINTECVLVSIIHEIESRIPQLRKLSGKFVKQYDPHIGSRYKVNSPIHIGPLIREILVPCVRVWWNPRTWSGTRWIEDPNLNQ